MARVKVGMPAAGVRALLGSPDDIRTQNDPGGISTTRTLEIWCYGTSGHLTFPTLGMVYIDQHNRAQYMHGGRGTPPTRALMSERRLRKLLRLIDRAPALVGHKYNPRPVIEIVNALQGLGKSKALAVISEYLRVASVFHSDARQGLFVVLRVLFDVPTKTGYHPRMYVGAPSPRTPKDPKSAPRFPVHLTGDVPLLLVAGYLLMGMAERVERHVKHYKKSGRLRGRPLRPTSKPLELLDRLPAAILALYGPAKSARLLHWRWMLSTQLLRLIDTVHRLPRGPRARSTLGAGFNRHWKRQVTKVAKRPILWQPKQGCYTFKDGTRLPARKIIAYRRHLWKPTLKPGRLEVTLQRMDAARIRAGIRWHTKQGATPPRATIRIYALGSGGQRRVLTQFSLGAPAAARTGTRSRVVASSGKQRWVVQGSWVRLKPGVKLGVDCTSTGTTLTSPTFDPDAVQSIRLRK